MLTIDDRLHYYFSIDTVDFRNRIRGLSAHVANVLGADPKDPDAVYVFLNSGRKEVRLLHYEGNGYVLYCKRLNRGIRFRRPLTVNKAGRIEMSWLEFRLLMEGVVRPDLPLSGT